MVSLGHKELKVLSISQFCHRHVLCNIWLSRNGTIKTRSLYWSSAQVPTLLFMVPGGYCAIEIPRGGYSVRKLLGVCRGPLKIGPKKIEGKMVFWGQKDRILRGFVPKRLFLCWWMRNNTPKRSCSILPKWKRGSKPRHICITHHIGSTTPGRNPISTM